MPKSYTAFLMALMAAGGWFFTAGPGKNTKFADIWASISQQGQGSAQGQFGTAPNPSGGYFPNNPSYQPQQASAQMPVNYGAPPVAPPAPTPMFGGPAIRIASFNIQVFGDAKASKPYVMATLAAIIQNFHVVAIQEIRTQDDYFIDNFLRTYVNVNGRAYDKIVGPRLGSTVSTEQYAFLYDTAAVEVNRRSVFTVNDPDHLLERDPLVAMFRVRGPPPEQAFTFVLVDMHTRPDKYAEGECNTLAQVYQAVRRASGGEDDIILLGDLNVDDKHLGQLGQIDGVKPVVRNTFTNTRQNAQYDNMMYHQPSTTEFSGKWGVFDFPRLFNLTPDQALQVSDHMPIWAEFSAYESTTPGRVAERNSGMITQ